MAPACHGLCQQALRSKRLQENIAKEVPRSFSVSSYDWPDAPWYRRLELWKRASQFKAVYQVRRTQAARAHGAIVEDDRLQWLEKERRERSRQKIRTVDLAKMATLDDALNAYAENLDVIIRLVREAHSEPILMAQAIQFDELTEQQQKELWMGAMDGGKTYIEMSQLQDLVRKYNARMEAVAEARDVKFIPLPNLLEGQQDLFYDSIHFHEAGARAVARVVADYLIQNVYNLPSAKAADSDHG
jgi:lysophospholipase L1-like esterase